MAIKTNCLNVEQILGLCQTKAPLVVQECVPVFTTIQSLALNKYVSSTEIKPLYFHTLSTFSLENWNLEPLSSTDSKTIGCWKREYQTLSLVYDEKRLRQGRLKIQDKDVDIPPERIYIQWNKNLRNLMPYIFEKEGEEELYLVEPGTDRIICIKSQKETDTADWTAEQSEKIKSALPDLLKAHPTSNLSLQGAKTLDHCCNAVCRIVMNGTQTEKVDLWGTGFGIGNRLIMTNHHVLDTQEKCKNSQAEFFFNQKKIIVQFKPEELFITSQTPKGVGPNQLSLAGLDFTIVAIEDHPGLKEVFTHPIALNEFDNPQENGSINIIHHPSGKEKAVDSAKYFNHKVAKVNQFYFTYGADTEPGSSGAPVFDHSWRLLGLHRQTEGRNPSTEKVAIKIGAIYHHLFTTYENEFTISNLARIQEPQFHPLLEEANSKLQEGATENQLPPLSSEFKFGTKDVKVFEQAVKVKGNFKPRGPKALSPEEILQATQAARQVHSLALGADPQRNVITHLINQAEKTFKGPVKIEGDWDETNQ